jgi:hypothetical protein
VASGLLGRRQAQRNGYEPNFTIISLTIMALQQMIVDHATLMTPLGSEIFTQPWVYAVNHNNTADDRLYYKAVTGMQMMVG